MIVRISDYIFRKEEKIKKGIDEVMGGKVLQLESERLFELGEARGTIIGKAEGKAEGKLQAKKEIVQSLAERGMNLGDIAEIIKVSFGSISIFL